MIKFYLAHPKRSKSIVYFWACGHKVYTNISVPTSNWDTRRQRLKKNALRINENLDLIDGKVSGKVAETRMAGGKVSKNMLYECIGKEQRQDMKFVAWCEAFTEMEKKSLKKKTTILGYTTFVNHLKAYEKSRKVVLSFADIDMDFYKDFEIYFVKELSNHPNTFGRAISKIKVFMNAAAEKGITKSQGHKAKGFKAKETAGRKIALYPNELLQIWSAVMPHKRLEMPRDFLIAACWTALRVSDYKAKLRPEYISDTPKGKVIKLETKKTGEFVAIPLHWMLEEILRKYNYIMVWEQSEKTFNNLIKKVCEAAGIDSFVTIREYEKGVPVDKTYRKWELITSHTGRRSLATNLTLAGVPKQVSMKLTGHASEIDFDAYLQIDNEIAANFIRESNIFQR